MASTLYQLLIAILERQAKAKFVRYGKGSHEIWRIPEPERTIVIPRTIKSTHTANECLKSAGRPKRFSKFYPSPPANPKGIGLHH